MSGSVERLARVRKPIVWAALCSAVLLGCRPLERPYTHYASYEAALADGAVRRGRVPSWIPASSFDIHEQHDLDTNVRCLRFSLPPGAAGHLRERLDPLSGDEIDQLDARCRIDPLWWFDGIVQQDPANDGALNAELFRFVGSSGEEKSNVAIDRVTDRVYVWSR